MNRRFVSIFCIGTVFLFLAGCASHYKKRQQQRDRVAAATGLFCEFVSGDEFTDVDVEINIRMAKKCDLEKPLNFTSYKNASDNFGIVYCCQTGKSSAPKVEKSKLNEEAGLDLDAPLNSVAPSKKGKKSSAKKTDLRKTDPKKSQNASKPPEPTGSSSSASGSSSPSGSSGATSEASNSSGSSGSSPSSSSSGASSSSSGNSQPPQGTSSTDSATPPASSNTQPPPSNPTSPSQP